MKNIANKGHKKKFTARNLCICRPIFLAYTYGTCISSGGCRGDTECSNRKTILIFSYGLVFDVTLFG